MDSDLFIDFDGVLCDSKLECLASSWYAYFILYKREEPVAVSLETKRRFAALRPYIRTGGDYLLLQEIIDKNISVASQEDFDTCLDGGETASRAGLYAQLFYKARAYLLRTYSGSWIRLNPLYAHVRSRLPGWTASDRFYILSTKKPAYVARILESNRIKMPLERILHSPARGKLGMVRRRLEEDTRRRAVLVDDQLDHLIGNREPRIKPYLASWGYVRPEWLAGKHGVEILSPDRFIHLVDSSLAPPPERH
jgi:hypothetical protein